MDMAGYGVARLYPNWIAGTFSVCSSVLPLLDSCGRSNSRCSNKKNPDYVLLAPGNAIHTRILYKRTRLCALRPGGGGNG